MPHWTGEWQATARNMENRGYFLFPQHRAVTHNLWNISGEMGNCYLDVLATHADFEEIAEVKKVSVSRQDRESVEWA